LTYLTINAVSKCYNGRPALEKIHLEIAKGDIICLLGPSGCGKTTLLRIIAGLTALDSGQILLDGRNINSIPAHVRRFGLMFQEFALFPHKNVFENVAFGLKMQGMDGEEIEDRTRKMLKLVGMSRFMHRDVADLSGGERQRVALARSLAPRPHLLMLDEPFGALDRALRQRLMTDLINIIQRVDVTTIFVTHDQTEAFALADKIAVMQAGRIEQYSPPEILYKHPINTRVASFLGFENLLPAKVMQAGMVVTQLGPLSIATHGLAPGESVTVLLRPEGVCYAEDSKTTDADAFLVKGMVTATLFLGSCYRVCLRATQGPMLVFDILNNQPPPKPGDPVRLRLKPAAITLIRSIAKKSKQNAPLE
jgi:ABC-type Fe3+/spermidine/putrescine transport system ATPase subunit